jgi:hypothetical protein
VPLTRDYIVAAEGAYARDERDRAEGVDDDVEWLIDEEPVEEGAERG